MTPHPDFTESALPRHAQLGPFALTPLSPAEVREDFDAVTGSEAVLTGLMGGDWPRGLTLDANGIDLAWHDREFTARRSFAWIVRDTSGAYLGCAYLYPDIGARGRGTVVTWMRDLPGRLDLLADFNAVFDTWIAAFLPAGFTVDRITNDR